MMGSSARGRGRHSPTHMGPPCPETLRMKVGVMSWRKNPNKLNYAATIRGCLSIWERSPGPAAMLRESPGPGGGGTWGCLAGSRQQPAACDCVSLQVT